MLLPALSAKEKKLLEQNLLSQDVGSHLSSEEEKGNYVLLVA
jgi:hypothetical protein